jgi:hypothetical protein
MTTLEGDSVGAYVCRNYPRLVAIAADPADRRQRTAAQVLDLFDENGDPKPQRVMVDDDEDDDDVGE